MKQCNRKCTLCIPWARKTRISMTHQTPHFAFGRLREDRLHQKYCLVVEGSLLTLEWTLEPIHLFHSYQSPTIWGPRVYRKMMVSMEVGGSCPFKAARGHNNSPYQSLEYKTSKKTIGWTIGGLQRKWRRKQIWISVKWFHLTVTWRLTMSAMLRLEQSTIHQFVLWVYTLQRICSCLKVYDFLLHQGRFWSHIAIWFGAEIENSQTSRLIDLNFFVLSFSHSPSRYMG